MRFLGLLNLSHTGSRLGPSLRLNFGRRTFIRAMAASQSQAQHTFVEKLTSKVQSETNGDNKSSILNWVAPDDKSGEFKRKDSNFRGWIKNEAGAEFPAEKDRYHLYVSYACPWGVSGSKAASCP